MLKPTGRMFPKHLYILLRLLYGWLTRSRPLVLAPTAAMTKGVSWDLKQGIQHFIHRTGGKDAE